MEKQVTKIGWIGTGVMGFSMAKHLINAGYNLTVYNRTKSKLQGLLDLGAVYAEPKDIAKEVDFLFMIVGLPKDVEELTISEETGIIKYMKKGSYLVDHTTSSPSLAVKIHEYAKQYSVHAYDAPVTGGDVGAREGKLITLVGGDAEPFPVLFEILKKYSKVSERLGGAGIGQHTKATNQIMIATKIIGVCEGVMYAYKAGLDIKKTFEVLSQGASSSTQMTVYTPRIFKRDFEPGFFAEHFIKDMGIALEECKRMNLQLKGLELAYSFYQLMVEEGLEKKGHHGILLVLEKLNGIKVDVIES